MSLPDLVLDATMSGDRLDARSKDSGVDSVKDGVSEDSGMMTLSQGSERRCTTSNGSSPHSSRSASSRSCATSGSRSRCSVISVESYESESLSMDMLDEGEARWDALGRMSSIRRSNRFHKQLLVTVSLRRGKDGFGLELEGNAPPTIFDVFGEAKGSGLRPGDRLVEVNGNSVRGLTHEEAGRFIAEGPDVATLLVHTLKPTPTPDGQIIYSGWLMKRGGSGMTPRNWRRRWFVVRDDCIAYYYAAPAELQPLGAIVLRNYTVSKACDMRKPFSFKIVKGGARSYYFCADSEQEMNKWAQVLTEGATLEGRESVHFSEASHNVSLSALSIKDPDCHGWVYKQGNGIKSWRRRYCVLKSHQLFYYGKMSHTTAYGVMNLRSYQILCGKSKDKKYYFNAVSPDKGMRDFHFYTETEGDRERWMQAMQKSIVGARTRTKK